MSRHQARTAFVLVIVVSVAAILSVLAVTFAMVAGIERNVSANYVDLVRARMLATAGVDDALLRLRSDAPRRLYNAPTDPWFYAGTYVNGVPQPDTPLEDADYPSYRAGALTVDGLARGYSGALAGTYARLGDTYALRITDLASKFDINGQETHLAEMLSALGRGIRRLDHRPDPIRERGAAILALRNGRYGGRFRSLADLLSILTQDELDVLRDYVTLDSWRDRSVIEPRPQDPAEWPVEHYDFEPPVGYPGRHPVNLNTAPLPVLFACISGLSARIMKGDDLRDVPPITDGQAMNVARQVGEARQARPFQTWEAFEEWCWEDLESISKDQRGALVANANPNTRLNKFVPDATERTAGQARERPADKTDLTYHTTEFTLWDLGWFEVESLGRVLDQEDRLVACAKLLAVVKVYDIARHTTQRDFVMAAVRPETFDAVRTFPESMADQEGDPMRASIVDGRVQAREDDAREGDEVFWADNDDTLAARLHPGQVEQRWYTNLYDQDRRARRWDLAENHPADEGLPYVPRQDPFERSLMNPTLPQAYRNSLWGSNLYPDGHFVSSRCERVCLFPGVDPHDGRPFLDPEHSVFQFWMKQDPRADKVDGLFAHVIPGAGQPIPSGPGGGQDLYAYFLGGAGLNGGHASWLTGGIVLPQCRRAPIAYPFDRDYLWLDLTPFGNRLPRPGQWVQIRVELEGHTTMRLYVDGELERSSTAVFHDVALNTTNVLDMLQFGHAYVHSYRSDSDWIGWSDAIVDTIRVYDHVGGGRQQPDRFPVSSGGTYFEGAFVFGPTPVRVLGVGFSQTRPRVIARRGGIAPIADPPYVSLEVRAPGGAWVSAGPVGDGAPLDLSIGAGEGLEYRARFHDNGLSPNNAAAVLEDVTVLYSTGPEIKGWVFQSP